MKSVLSNAVYPLLLLLMATLALPAQAQDDCLYAIDLGANSSHDTTLYDVNPQTGQASNPRKTGMGNAIGLALGQDGFLYAVTAGVAPQPNSLYRINPTSGNATLIGSLGIGGLAEGDLAFHPNGTLYGVSNQIKLFTVNTSTGAATSLPNLSSWTSDYSSLAFHNNGTLYALDNYWQAGQSANLWQTINPGAGAIVSSSTVNYYMGPAGGMDFDSNNGRFFLIDSKYSGSPTPGTNSLYRVDLNGNRTLIGPLGVSGAFAGLASCKSGPEPDLVVSSATFNASCDLEFEIKNVGSGDAVGWFPFTSWPLHVPAWGQGPHTGWSASINGLPAGQSTTQTWGSMQIFGPTLNVHVDPQNSIPESDDGNNISSFSVPHSCIFSPSSCVAPPRDMQGWYPFDETGGILALDIVGLHFGLKTNGPTPVPGMVANALKFDGVDDRVRVPHSNDFNFDGPGKSGTFTIDAWIKTNGSSGGTIVSKSAYGGVPTLKRGYSFAATGGVLLFSMDTEAASPFTHIVFENNVIPPDTWTHVAVTVDRNASPSIILYVDGQPVESDQSYPQTLTDNTAPLYIGARENHDTGEFYTFDGIIDEVEIFDRALTGNEIYTLYAAQSYGKCKNPCPAFKALSEGKVSSSGEQSAAHVAHVLYRLRDERLMSSPNGLYFNHLFQEHRLRIAYLMLRSEKLRQAAEQVLYDYAPGLEMQLDGMGAEVVLKESMVVRVADFANLLIETDLAHDGRELALAVDREVRRIDWEGLVGKSFDDLWLMLDTLPLER